jgi:hypothetical protein
MKKYLMIAGVLFAQAGLASTGMWMGSANLPPVDCDQMLSGLASRGGTIDPKTYQYSGLVRFENGKIQFDKNDPRIKSFRQEGGKTIIQFKESDVMMSGRRQGNSPVDTTTLVFEEMGNGYVVHYDEDPARVARREEQVRKAGAASGMGMWPTYTGQTSRVDRLANGCVLNQMSFEQKQFESIYHDRKFCQSVEGALKDKGFEKISECKDVFETIKSA